MANVVGRARAKALGYYPDDGVHFRFINAGEEFDVIEGREKGGWFERIDEPVADAKPAAKPRKGKAAETGDPGADSGGGII